MEFNYLQKKKKLKMRLIRLKLLNFRVIHNQKFS